MDPLIEQVLGREPKSGEQVIRELLKADPTTFGTRIMSRKYNSSSEQNSLKEILRMIGLS